MGANCATLQELVKNAFFLSGSGATMTLQILPPLTAGNDNRFRFFFCFSPFEFRTAALPYQNVPH